MPVTFKVAAQDAAPVERYGYASVLESADEILGSTWGRQYRTQKVKEILQSSLPKDAISSIVAKRNGFVDTVVSAYNEHQHLVIRPDDVWIAILSQFNL
ncbi:hypothetical protein NLJ89_g12200 [Agrocybe chaxingu]|uniref:Uncharacterized protein n=1 Tax=Agrocybe chaxingu TaxID=84603 RepID=A0A9W8JMY1_9AGAR|nr:hypothetical protein NLJ89_g12200 [Agrocybe chaxingu]